MRHRFLIFFLMFSLTAGLTYTQNQAQVLVDKMVKSMRAITTLQGTMKRSERVEGAMADGGMNFKLRLKPHALYIYNKAPDEGAEVMYIQAANEGKAYIHPNKFPYVNLSMDPRNKLLTGGQHHSMESVGFEKMLRIVTAALKKYGDRFDQYVSYKGEVSWYGKKVDVIEINFSDYAIETYTALPGEDLWAIARKLNVPEYRMMELNNMKGYTDVRAGQQLKVPNAYAPRCVFYVDKVYHLPIVQLIYDERGLYEKYEYSNLKVNIPFGQLDFDLRNPEYGFFK